MKYSFTCHGHENITARHKTTLEFTKDRDLGPEGDCIVGAGADFSIKEIKKFIKSLRNNNSITIVVETISKDYNKKNNNAKTFGENKIIEKINAEINPNFDSDKDMVIRKSDFIDGRTFAARADKAAFELNRGLIKFLQWPSHRVRVILN